MRPYLCLLCTHLVLQGGQAALHLFSVASILQFQVSRGREKRSWEHAVT